MSTATINTVAPALTPVLKTLQARDGHCCPTFRVAEGGVHECDHGREVLHDDVPAAAARAQQQGDR